MIQRIKRGFKKIRRIFSRGEWTVRLLSLGRSPETRAKPGLILVQIDGLSRMQMERAIRFPKTIRAICARKISEARFWAF